MGLFVDKNIAVYFNCFGIKYIPQEVLNKIKDKSNSLNISRKQSDDSIMCEFYFIAFKERMLAGKTLPYYTNFFSPNNYRKMNYKRQHKPWLQI